MKQMNTYFVRGKMKVKGLNLTNQHSMYRPLPRRKKWYNLREYEKIQRLKAMNEKIARHLKKHYGET